MSDVMKICPACGREMMRAGTCWECTNPACDYDEEVSENNK